MRWIRNVRVKTKLVFGFLVMIFLMVIISLAGYSGIGQVHREIEKINTVILPSINLLMQTDRDLHQLLVAERSMIFANAKSDIFQDLVKSYEENRQQSTERWEKYKALAKDKSEQELIRRYESLRTEWEALSREIVDGRVADTREGRRKALDLSLGPAKEKFETMRQYVDELSEISVARAHKIHQISGPIYRQTLFFLFLVTGIGLLLAIFIVWGLDRIITKPITTIAKGARRFSVGDIQMHGLNWDVIDAINQRNDELGETGRAFSGLIAYMKEKSEVVSQIADGNLNLKIAMKSDQDQLGASLVRMLDNLNQVMRDFQVTVNQVETGSRQVSDSSQNLSQGAIEQAASLEEITSTMQEIAAQTKTNAGNAGQANQLGATAKDASQQGVQQMASMTEAMDAINQSSQEIAKIIKTIDDIAFQTNLLALNAAVEAARAGKHGKGFAVVAQEVRSLASRSAKAAQETAQLIETGKKKVDNGIDIATETSAALTNINEGVTRVTEILDEIAAASNEQAQGAAQVNAGLTEIDSVTQQNSAGAEEMASSAEELSRQAKSLQQLLSRFRLAPKTQKAAQSHPHSTESVSRDVLIPWGPQYSVGVQKMDNQHMRLVDIINDLYAALKSGKAREKQAQILDGLLEYTKDHFSQEEAILRTSGYAGLAEQEKLHRAFEGEIAKYLQKMESGGSLGAEAMNFLKKWLLNHIQVVDKKYEAVIGDARHSHPQPMRNASAKVPLQALPAAPPSRDVLVSWGPQYSVGVQKMDDQHMRLVDIINDLYAALKSGKAREKQAQILDGLLEYTKEHFAQEEALMRVNHYEGLAEQEKLHRAFEAEIAKYAEKMESGKSLGVETMNFLKKWLVNHIQVVDKKYGTAIGDSKPAGHAVRQPAAQDYQWGS